MNAFRQKDLIPSKALKIQTDYNKPSLNWYFV